MLTYKYRITRRTESNGYNDTKTLYRVYRKRQLFGIINLPLWKLVDIAFTLDQAKRIRDEEVID